MNTNNAPFRVGQRVVCVNPISPLKKGEVYTVGGVHLCPSCGKWQVGVVEFASAIDRTSCPCSQTSGYKTTNHMYVFAYRFAPIEPRSVSIPESLKEQAEELVNVKETIAEPEKETV